MSPNDLIVFVKYSPKPFAKPQDSNQDRINSKGSLNLLKTDLSNILEAHPEIQPIYKYNSRPMLIIPEKCFDAGNAGNTEKTYHENPIWKEILKSLESSIYVEEISILVNNDISKEIATNMADYVGKQWNKGYQGKDKETVIYHK